MKRQSIKNAFGDDMYVPSIPDADLDLSMPDIGLPDIDPDEEDYNLFDYDRTDNHTDTRYMRPRPTRMPAQCVRYDNADAMARVLKITTGMRIDCFISGAWPAFIPKPATSIHSEGRKWSSTARPTCAHHRTSNKSPSRKTLPSTTSTTTPTISSSMNIAPSIIP